MWNNEIKQALEEGKQVKFMYCGKEILLERGTTLNKLQEAFGHELDVVDLMYAEYEIK